MDRSAGLGSDASTSGRRSPLRVRSIVCLEAATPDQAGAANTVTLVSIEVIATTRLQAIKKRRRFLSRDETKPNICGDMMRSPSPYE